MRILARVMVPYKFGIESDAPIFFNFNSERVLITLHLCEGVHVLSYLSNNLDWIKASKKGRLSFKIIEKVDGKSIPIREVFVDPGNEDYLEGTIDILMSTIFDISFEFPNTQFSDNEPTREKIKEKAIFILRFFINTYRSLTSQADVHNPSNLDLPVFELAYSKKKYASDKEILDCEYTFLSRTLNWFPPEATGYFKKNISLDVFKDFYLYLNSNEPVPIHLQLLADAREYAVLKKDYKISIILSATATETYLQNRLIGECYLRKISSLTTGRGKERSTKNYMDAILNGNIREDLLGDICKELTGKNINQSIFYQNWYNDAYLIRNKIIHQAKMINNENEAKRAFEVVRDLINYVHELLIKGRGN